MKTFRYFDGQEVKVGDAVEGPHQIIGRVELLLEPGSSIAIAHGVPAGGMLFQFSDGSIVEIGNALRDRFAGQELIEVRPQPMRVRIVIADAGRDQQFVRAIAARLEVAIKLMMKITEAPFQAANDLRIGLFPTSVVRQRSDSR